MKGTANIKGRSTSPISSNKKKNIVVIMADQLGAAMLGCYGSGVDSTPFLDSLAREGVMFTRCYATSPVCWDSAPWNDSCTSKKWRLAPESFGKLLQMAKSHALKRRDISSRLIMLDNWNEYGEGHYIIPAQQYGFGYLQAVKEVFSK